MDILNRLIEDLLKRSTVSFSGTFTIGLRRGRIEVAGEIPTTVKDTEKPNNVKTIANMVVPIKTVVAVDDMTFPIPGQK